MKDNIQYFGVKGRYFSINTQFFVKKLSQTAREIYLDLCARRNIKSGLTIPRKTAGGNDPDYQKQRRALKSLVDQNLISSDHRILISLDCDIWGGYNLFEIFKSFGKNQNWSTRQTEKRCHFTNGLLSSFDVVQCFKKCVFLSEYEKNLSEYEKNLSEYEKNLSEYESITIRDTIKDTNHHHHTLSMNIDSELLKKFDDDDLKKEIELRLKGKKIKSSGYLLFVKKSILNEGLFMLNLERKKAEGQQKAKAKWEEERREYQKKLEEAENAPKSRAFKINPITFAIEYI